MKNPTLYQKLVANAKRNINEIPPAQAAGESQRGDAILIDVREES